MFNFRSTLAVCMSLLMFACTGDDVTVDREVDVETEFTIDTSNSEISYKGAQLRENYAIDQDAAWIEVPYSVSSGVTVDITDISLPGGVSFVDQYKYFDVPSGSGVMKFYLEGAPTVSGNYGYGFTLTCLENYDFSYTIDRVNFGQIQILGETETVDDIVFMTPELSGDVYLYGESQDVVYLLVSYTNGWGREVTFSFDESSSNALYFEQSTFTLESGDALNVLEIPISVSSSLTSLDALTLTLKASYTANTGDSDKTEVNDIPAINFTPKYVDIVFSETVSAVSTWNTSSSSNTLQVSYQYGHDRKVNVAVRFNDEQGELSVSNGEYTLSGTSLMLAVNGNPIAEDIEATITLTGDGITDGELVLTYFSSELNQFRLEDFSAENYPTGSTWTIYDSSAEIADFKGLKDAIKAYDKSLSLVFPYLSALPECTSIEDAPFGDCSKVTSIEFSKVTVSELPAYYFYGCSALTSLTIGGTPTKVGDYAFYGCSSLVNVPSVATITEIGNYAFANCAKIATVSTAQITKVGDFGFAKCTSLSTIDMSKIQSIGDFGFYGCTALSSSLTLSALDSVGDNGFAGCTALVSVTVPELEEIGDNAFSGCSNLTTVTGDKLTKVGAGAFVNCTKLSNIDIDALTEIGERAFAYCSGFGAIELNNYSGELLEGCFQYSGITSFLAPKVTSLGNSVFKGCSSLSSVTLAGVTSMGDSVFSGCSSLSFIEIATSASLNDITSLTFSDFPYYNCELTLGEGYNTSNFSISGSIFSSNGTTYVFKAVNGVETLTFDSFAEGGYYHSASGNGLPESNTWTIYDDSFATTDSEALMLALARVPEGELIVLDFSLSTFTAFPSYFSYTYSTHSDEHNAAKDTGKLRVESMIFPTTVTSIGARGVRGMNSLISLTGTENVATIGGFGMRDNTALAELDLRSLTYLDTYVFGKTPLTKLTLGNDTQVTYSDTWNSGSFSASNCDLYFVSVDDTSILTSNSWGGTTWKSISILEE